MTITARGTPPPTPEQVRGALAACPALAQGCGDALDRLAASGHLRQFRKGSYLFHQGEDADAVVVLCDGRVEITSTSPSGDRQLHTVLSPPQLFGELGVLADQPRSTSALAVADAAVLWLPATAFLAFLTEDPHAALGVMRALAQQVHAYGDLVDDLLFLDLRARVAKRLLGLVTPSTAALPADGTKVPDGVTQADLANLAGGSRENVSRILSEFVRRGLLERTGRGQYVLADVDGLRRTAQVQRS